MLLRQTVRRFRRDPGPSGMFLLQGLPIDDVLPLTPTVAGSARRIATVSSAVLFMIALGLGEPIAFAQEKSGAIVQDVVPVRALAGSQSNGGSVALSFHTENAFHPCRPDYVLLLCLRPDPLHVAALRIAGIRRALRLLDLGDQEALRCPWYVTESPPSFGPAVRRTPPRPVLDGSTDDPDVAVDFSATWTNEPRGIEALAHLREAVGEVAVDVRLRQGELAMVDNRLAIHGRNQFQPAYEGSDRWLHRMFVQADFRRSRGARSGDGHVLER